MFFLSFFFKQGIMITLSAHYRWQQLLINKFVGYDTILMNSLLNSPGQGITWKKLQEYVQLLRWSVTMHF